MPKRGSNIKRPTTVGTGLDVGRLASALRSPGIDTRFWVSHAIVRSVKVDAVHGAFAKVTLLPSLDTFVARVPSVYAGAGFGMWSPLAVDDEVVVEAPSGDPTEGLVVTGRPWSKADPPPAEAVDHPEDWLLRTKKGVKARFIAGAELDITAEDSDVVVQSGTLKVARDTDPTVNGTISMTQIPTVLPAPPGTLITFTYTPPGGLPTTIGTIVLLTAGGTAVGGSADITGKIDGGADHFKG